MADALFVHVRMAFLRHEAEKPAANLIFGERKMASRPHSNQSVDAPGRVVNRSKLNNSLLSLAVSTGGLRIKLPHRLAAALGLAAALVCWLAPGPAQAINKCTGADGKVTFQDGLCAGQGEAITVKPASGAGLPGGTLPGVSDAQRINAQTEQSQRERRVRELETLWLPQAQANLAAHKQRCEQQQRSLASDQYRYQQNLYGKTHSAQRASEMAAVAATCDTKDRELTSHVERLKAELSELKK